LRHRQSALVARAGSWSVLPNGIRPSHRFIARFFLDGIRHAQKSIYVSTPYFAPNHQLFRALRLAALRGIDVRLLLPQRSDSRFAERVAESYYSGALRAGIRIFLYEPSFLHSKTIVIDDDWASVGSSNFDYLSMSFNYELNVLSYSSRFALEIKNHFFEDLQSAAEVMPEEWNGRFFLRKIFEKALIPLRIFV
jgi:cardiolipin synthase